MAKSVKDPAPTTAKATAKKVVAKAPVAVPGKTAVVGVLRKGKVVKVAMPVAQAQALRARRAAGKAAGGSSAGGADADTVAAIPSAYRGVVNAKEIQDAVAAQINSLNQPLEQGKANAQTQFASNAAASASLNAQTQASLDTLLANTHDRAVGYQQLDQQAAANRAAQAQAALTGAGPVNAQTQALIQQQLAPGLAQGNAAGVQATWADRLGSAAQSDFFQRAKGIGDITQQSFTEGQRKQLSSVLSNIAAAQAANLGKKATMTRDLAQEDFALASTMADSQTKAAAAKAKASVDQQNANTAAYRAQHAGDTAASNATTKLQAAQQKKVDAVQKAIDALVARTSKPVSVTTPVIGPDGKQKLDIHGKPMTTTVTKVPSVTDVFGKGGGPWRTAFQKLIAGNVGLTRDQAAVLATQWYGQNFAKGSTPAKIKTLLTNRNVKPATQKAIIIDAFGADGWASVANATSGSSGGSKPASSKPKPGGAGKYTGSWQNDGLLLSKLQHYGAVGSSILVGNDSYKVVGARGVSPTTYTVTGGPHGQFTVTL